MRHLAVILVIELDTAKGVMTPPLVAPVDVRSPVSSKLDAPKKSSVLLSRLNGCAKFAHLLALLVGLWGAGGVFFVHSLLVALFTNRYRPTLLALQLELLA